MWKAAAGTFFLHSERHVHPGIGKTLWKQSPVTEVPHFLNFLHGIVYCKDALCNFNFYFLFLCHSYRTTLNGNQRVMIWISS